MAPVSSDYEAAAVTEVEEDPEIPDSSQTRFRLNCAKLSLLVPRGNSNRYGTLTTILVGAASLVSLWMLVWWGQPFDVRLRLRIAGSTTKTTPRIDGAGAGCPDSSAERGNRLLHAWTDDELFSKAAAAMESRSLKGVADLECADGDYLIGEVKAKACGLKIAFLFLCRGEPPLAALWNQYFREHEGLYNIYLHVDPIDLTAVRRSAGVFWGRVVPSQRAKRGSPELIAAARRLMANALVDDPRNQWFAIISDSCIPLHSLPYAYTALSSTNKSFMGWTANDGHLLDRWRARGENVMLPEIPFSDFRVGSQFFIVRRRHALLIVRDNKYWPKFRLPCINNWNCFPEEHYFSTLISTLDPNGTTMYNPTFVDWSKSLTCPRHGKGPGHPREFCHKDVSRGLIRDLRSRDDHRYLFARKFPPDSLPVLVNIVDEILS